MQVLFHSNQLDARGTTDQLYKYAHYCEAILGHQSYIAAPASSDLFSSPLFQERFKDRVLLYTSISQLETYVEALGIDVVYFIRYGTKEPLLDVKAKQVVHAVFNTPYEQNCYGDRYAYVSEWLSEVNDGAPFVPHIVELPEVGENYREVLGIPEDAIVIARHGGADTFDIKYAQQSVALIARNVPEMYFLFLNTHSFCPPLPNILHLAPTHDKEVIKSFLNTADVYLHGRERGESFGIAIAEALACNLPVVTSISGEDRNHIKMLGDKGFYYSSGPELEYMLLNFKKEEKNYKALVEQFSAKTVMEKFNDVFLK